MIKLSALEETAGFAKRWQGTFQVTGDEMLALCQALREADSELEIIEEYGSELDQERAIRARAAIRKLVDFE